jgi:predicted  nucleic acid-binding Zn-ribbon protein
MGESDDLHYIRHTLATLTEQVSKLAQAMERLATMEERSISLTKQINQCESDIQKLEDRTEKRFEKIEEKQSATNIHVVKILTVFAVFMFFATSALPLFMKAVFP